MMLNMTSFEFGDVVLVPFPFTDLEGSKKPPTVVVSSNAYQIHRPDVLLLAITSRVRSTHAFGEAVIGQWKKAGLLKPSTLKPVIFTVEQHHVLKSLGKLGTEDMQILRSILNQIMGEA